MKKKNFHNARLPREAQDLLRHRGGAHSSRKGRKGYDRNKNKEKCFLRKLLQG